MNLFESFIKDHLDPKFNKYSDYKQVTLVTLDRLLEYIKPEFEKELKKAGYKEDAGFISKAT